MEKKCDLEVKNGGLPPSVGEFAVEDRQRLLSKVEEQAREIERLNGSKWEYCPECGSEQIHHEEGDHKQCADCYQEWFADIDYSDVVRVHLGGKYRDKDAIIEQLNARIAALKAQPGGVVLPERKPVEPLDFNRTTADVEAIAHNACLDEVARLNSSPVSSGGKMRPVLAMILNALDRDAANGRPARGEMATELRAAMAVSNDPVSAGDVPARPTGLSQGWNLVRQCDGFVIGHSAEEPKEQHKANALNDGRVYVPFLVPVSSGEYGDAYQGAREDLAIWKRRALEAEALLRTADEEKLQAVLSAVIRCEQKGAFKICLECGYQDGHDQICQYHESKRATVKDCLTVGGVDERDQLAAEAAYYRSTLRNVLKDIRDDLARGGLAESWRGVAETISVVLSNDRAALTAPAPDKDETATPTVAGWLRIDDDRGAILTRSKCTPDSQPLYLHPTAYRVTAPAPNHSEQVRGLVPDSLNKVIVYLGESLHQASNGVVPCGEDAIVECVSILEHVLAAPSAGSQGGDV